MKKSQTEFAYPVDKIHGKISKHNKVVHCCTASGQQTTYLQGTRNLNAHPVTAAEEARWSLFKRRQAVASARLKKSAETYEADMAAYHEQYAGGIKSFQGYIWSLVKAEINS